MIQTIHRNSVCLGAKTTILAVGSLHHKTRTFPSWNHCMHQQEPPMMTIPLFPTTATVFFFTLFFLDQASAGCGGRRRMQKILSPPLQMGDRINMLRNCNNQDYTMSITITGTHVGMAAIPNEMSEDCPILFLDDMINNNGKRITSLNDTPAFFLEEIPKYELGSFSLEKIFQSFQDATDSSSEKYDLLQNNCATFVISMMEDGLDVTVTVDHVAFAAEHLTEEDNSCLITSTLRAHKLFRVLFPRGDLTPNLGLMYEFVAEYVESHRTISS